MYVYVKDEKEGDTEYNLEKRGRGGPRSRQMDKDCDKHEEIYIEVSGTTF